MSAAVSIPLPPEPYELVIKGMDKPVAFACKTCGATYTSATFGGGELGETAARHMATVHCFHRCVCGAEIGPSRTKCDECWNKTLAEKAEKVFDRAKKVTLEDYPSDQPVYWDGLGDGYFLHIDELLDRCEEEGLEVPPYVWSCKEVPFRMEADWLLERALDSHGEGALQEIADKETEELQRLLDEWCARQDVKSWQVDYSTAVLLHPQD